MQGPAASVRSVGTPRERRRKPSVAGSVDRLWRDRKGGRRPRGGRGLGSHTTQGSSSGSALRFVPLLEPRAGPRINPGVTLRKASQPPAHPSPTARCGARGCVSRRGNQAQLSLQTVTALDTFRGKREKKKRQFTIADWSSTLPACPPGNLAQETDGQEAFQERVMTLR